MKKVLAESGPYEATMSVYQDFLRYTGGVYRYTYGAFLGYHAVTIVATMIRAAIGSPRIAGQRLGGERLVPHRLR